MLAALGVAFGYLATSPLYSLGRRVAI